MKKKLLSVVVAVTLFLSSGFGMVADARTSSTAKSPAVSQTKVIAKTAAKRRKAAKKVNKPAYKIPTGTEGEIFYKGCYININTDNQVLTGLKKPASFDTSQVFTGRDAATGATFTYQYFMFDFVDSVYDANSAAKLHLVFVAENGGTPKMYSYSLSGTGAQYGNITIEPNTNSEDIDVIEGEPDFQSGAFCSCCQVYTYDKSNGASVEYVFSHNELQCVTVYNSALENRYDF